MQDKRIVGRAEPLSLPEQDIHELHARIDTGAKTSSIWASGTLLEDGTLSVIFLNAGHPAYTGKPVIFSNFDTTAVASSNGHVQQRYKIRLLIKLKGRRIRAWFTLADRSTQVYPVLIGRNVLMGKFIVDVKQGTPLTADERQRTQALRANLEPHPEEDV